MMGRYLNKGSEAFRDARSAEYVDKSGLIAYINATLNTERRYSCITRCRRFGKSLAAKMLRAYYENSGDSHDLFEDLQIAKDASFEKYINKYTVIYLDVTDFTTIYRNDPDIVKHIQDDIKKELIDTYPEAKVCEDRDLMTVLVTISLKRKEKFFMIVDEWDAILREFDQNRETINDYINLCRSLFKGSDSESVFAGVYMTGILPIKRYQTESALNNFREYSMVDPGRLAPFFGFTEKEVETLSKRYSVSLDDLKTWYDGYRIGDELCMYNPYSVMEAVANGKCKSYWKSTGTYESVKTYMEMNFDGLKDDTIRMLAGEHLPVDTTTFQNDIHIVNSKDDVFTVLIHLGYLSYNEDDETCFIPNKEVAREMNNAVKATNWERLSETLQNSRALVEATLAGNEKAVEHGIDLAHDENTSILSYNDENSLSCVLTMAYLWAKNDFILHREFATGKGYADIILIPRRNVAKPAMVIELKYDKNAETAIDQIKNKKYPNKVAEYVDNLLIVGINYDKKSKTHSCKIVKYRV